MNELHDAKAALRATTRAARRSLDQDEREQRSTRGIARLLALHEMPKAHTVLLYAATPEECSLRQIWAPLLGRGVRLLLPRVEGERLALAAFSALTDLRPGGHGIWEPIGPAVDPALIDIAVIPGTAFDRRGGRLGMGGGYYDRLLAELDPGCLRVGFAFSCQVVTHVPREAHDQPVDVLVTDAATVRLTAASPDTA
ncbi:MAG: 5-formyltetrahydrofolate cyclo-ligase [Glaciecola sp.]|jgi:5-formyltetrahydrofolate cyclo-ligase